MAPELLSGDSYTEAVDMLVGSLCVADISGFLFVQVVVGRVVVRTVGWLLAVWAQ